MWWIEANKLFGYKKLVLCNHSFPDTDDYRRLFDKHKDFVQVYQMHYFPSVELNSTNSDNADEHHTYLDNFNQIHWKNTVVFEALVYNECYMRNIGRYKHVAVQGADELVIPRTNVKLLHDVDTFNLISGLELHSVNNKQALNLLLDVESSCNATTTATTTKRRKNKAKLSPSPPIDSYLRRLKKINEGSEQFYFKMGQYLTDVSVDLILNAFDKYLSSDVFEQIEAFNNNNNKKQQQQQQQQHARSGQGERRVHLITVLDTSYRKYNYTFRLHTERDINYARNLVKIYRLLIGDFKAAYAPLLKQLSVNQFDRFVYFADPMMFHFMGKSIFSTDHTLSVNVHATEEYDARQFSSLLRELVAHVQE